jgi:hypothetical protein
LVFLLPGTLKKLEDLIDVITRLFGAPFLILTITRRTIYMKNIILRTLVAVISIPVFFLGTPSLAHAADMTCPTPTQVLIDIKPGNTQNKIKLSSHGTLAVAVLTTSNFDARQFVPEMAHLNDANTAMADSCTGASAQHWSLDDENGDGRLDLVFFFNIQDLNLTLNSTAATLMAHGSYGGTEMHIEGTDTVKAVP